MRIINDDDEVVMELTYPYLQRYLLFCSLFVLNHTTFFKQKTSNICFIEKMNLTEENKTRARAQALTTQRKQKKER